MPNSTLGTLAEAYLSIQRDYHDRELARELNELKSTAATTSEDTVVQRTKMTAAAALIDMTMLLTNFFHG